MPRVEGSGCEPSHPRTNHGCLSDRPASGLEVFWVEQDNAMVDGLTGWFDLMVNLMLQPSRSRVGLASQVLLSRPTNYGSLEFTQRPRF